MGIKQAFTLALKSLSASKMRSFLTMLGIVIGVAAVIIIVSLVNGLTNEVISSFESIGATTISVNIRGRGGNRSVDIDDMQKLVEDNPEYLDSMTPNITIAGSTAKNGNTNINPTNCVGVNEYYDRIKDLTVEQGRGLSYMDCEGRLKNCVVGTYIAKELYGNTNVVGEDIKINGVNFKIVGVYEEKSDGKEGTGDDLIVLPYTVAQKLAYNFTISTYTFNAVSKDVAQEAEGVVNKYLLGIFASTDYFTIINMSSVIAEIDKITNMMSIVMAGIAGVSLLVGGIGIMNIMLVSVTERTREIGIRKSLGASPWDIMSQFVVEAITTSCIGGLIGIAFGIAGSFLSPLFGIEETKISIPAILIAFSVSALIGIGFGYMPAKKAARMNPIDALRYD